MTTDQNLPQHVGQVRNSIRRRSPMLGPRAVAGGLLVGIAAIGTFFLATGLNQQPHDAMIVANRDLPVGHRVTANDVRIATVPRVANARIHGFQSIQSVVGATLLGPVQSGEIIQSGTARAKQGNGDSVEVSFSIPAARALDGTLVSGETVDVLATAKSGAEPRAVTAASNARVLRAQTAGGGMGRSNEIIVTLALPNRNDASVLTTAIDSGQLTLVRTTGTTTGTTTS